MSRGDVAGPWRDYAVSISALDDLEAVEASLSAAASQFRALSGGDRDAWIAESVSAWRDIVNAATVRLFFGAWLAELSAWLLEDPGGRVDSFVAFTAASLDSPHRLAFVAAFAEFFPSMFADRAAPDINFVLAVQSAIFSFSVARQVESDAVFRLWFLPLTQSRGAAVFGTDRGAALGYFKIMRHAFFQAAITGPARATQDPGLIAAQDAMQGTIAAIARSGVS